MFLNFYILNTDEEHGAHNMDYPMLLNTAHVSTIKPINILVKGNIVAGYWIRMSNGKKYKATRIPQMLVDQLENSTLASKIVIKTDTGNESLDSFFAQ